MSDNHRFDMTIHLELLPEAMRIAFTQHSRATHYRVQDLLDADGEPCKTLVLMWGTSTSVADTFLPLPFSLDNTTSASFVRHWILDVVPRPMPTCYTDASIKLGVRVFNEQWGHVARDPYAFIAIQHCWLVYGK